LHVRVKLSSRPKIVSLVFNSWHWHLAGGDAVRDDCQMLQFEREIRQFYQTVRNLPRNLPLS